MLEFLRNISEGSTVTILTEFRQDPNWFLEFLKKFNGVTFFDIKPYEVEIKLDA